MENSNMLLLADRFKELRDKKAALQDELKALQAELDQAEAALVEAMTTEECSGFKRNGFGFSLVVKEYPGAIPELKAELYDAMKKHGFEHLFTINPMTLSGTVKELKSNNDDVLPDWLEGLVRIYEQPSITVRKSK